MARLLLFVTLILGIYSILHLLLKDMPQRKRGPRREAGIEELVQDPFCQTYIPKESALRRRVGGRDYYFCGEKCMKSYFEKER